MIEHLWARTITSKVRLMDNTKGALVAFTTVNTDAGFNFTFQDDSAPTPRRQTGRPELTNCPSQPQHAVQEQASPCTTSPAWPYWWRTAAGNAKCNTGWFSDRGGEQRRWAAWPDVLINNEHKTLKITEKNSCKPECRNETQVFTCIV